MAGGQGCSACPGAALEPRDEISAGRFWCSLSALEYRSARKDAFKLLRLGGRISTSQQEKQDEKHNLQSYFSPAWCLGRSARLALSTELPAAARAELCWSRVWDAAGRGRFWLPRAPWPAFLFIDVSNQGCAFVFCTLAAR